MATDHRSLNSLLAATILAPVLAMTFAAGDALAQECLNWGDKERKVAHAGPLSTWGDEAAHAMFRQKHVVPGKDFEIVQSGSEAASVNGVADGKFDAAAVNSNVLARMQARGAVDGAKIRRIWASQPLPPTSYGFAHNLTPDLQRKIHDAFLTFDWKGTQLATEFGTQADGFCTISYKDEWGPIRQMQEESGVVYDVKGL